MTQPWCKTDFVTGDEFKTRQKRIRYPTVGCVACPTAQSAIDNNLQVADRDPVYVLFGQASTDQKERDDMWKQLQSTCRIRRPSLDRVTQLTAVDVTATRMAIQHIRQRLQSDVALAYLASFEALIDVYLVYQGQSLTEDTIKQLITASRAALQRPLVRCSLVHRPGLEYLFTTVSSLLITWATLRDAAFRAVEMYFQSQPDYCIDKTIEDAFQRISRLSALASVTSSLPSPVTVSPPAPAALPVPRPSRRLLQPPPSLPSKAQPRRRRRPAFVQARPAGPRRPKQSTQLYGAKRKRATSWQAFLKAHRGQRLTSSQLSVLYRKQR